MTEEFSRGKTKAKECKPWQTLVDGKPTRTKLLCGVNGFLGCREYRPSDAFKWHGSLCSACVLALTMRYGCRPGDMDILLTVLVQERGLYILAAARGALERDLDAWRVGEEQRVAEFLAALLRNWNSKAVGPMNTAYRQRWMDAVGVTPPQPKTVAGFSTPAQVAAAA